jgi:hypothetical protein
MACSRVNNRIWKRERDIAKKWKTKNEKRKTKNEKRKTKNEKRKTKNEKRKTKNKKQNGKTEKHEAWKVKIWDEETKRGWGEKRKEKRGRSDGTYPHKKNVSISLQFWLTFVCPQSFK